MTSNDRPGIALDPTTVAFYAGAGAATRALDTLTGTSGFAHLDYTQQMLGVVFHATVNSREHTDTQAKAEAFLQGVVLRLPTRHGLLVEIDTDNAAFGGEDDDEEFNDYTRRREVARLLRRAADRIGNEDENDGSLLDYNGNAVGRFTLSED